ncbi:MAG: cupin domain-containing protein [Pseudomonadota bacterium]
MSFVTNNKIGDISIDDFLHNYWQKKPLLIRQAIPAFKSLITAEELAGLSLEEHIESRLMIEQGLDGQTPWQVKTGPLEEELFAQLPETNWTLLVQEANHHLPQLQELTDYFSFIPNWRFDDVMISYAVKNGSVGPHSDQYDVFLLQAEGQRHWHIAEYATTDKDLIENIDCRILKEFHSQQDWVLNPGDMLYLPPGVLHHGIAIDDCMTYSIGYNARTNGDILTGIIPYVMESGLLNNYYRDPELIQQLSSGEISNIALDKMQQQLQELFKDKQQLRHFFASYLTESLNPHNMPYEQEPITITQLKAYLDEQGYLYRNEVYRYAYIITDDGLYNLYINSHKIELSKQLMEFIPVLTGNRILKAELISNFIHLDGWTEFIHFLINNEYLLTDFS